ncbi:MAG: DUF1127 domain-containing protein [Paracoccus sp. (in: a-proteobacteria)]|nr:DUF1127 domain-containing protein [Paracoccus sp. (in: a-proteobacteria)]
MASTDIITQSAREARQAGTGILGLIARVQEGRARRALYRTTVAELSRLSARELADLGIERSMIPQVANQAAWGK